MYLEPSFFHIRSFTGTLFLFFFIFYLLFNSGHLGAYDAAMEYEVTKNLIRRGSFELRDRQFGEMDAARGIDGRLYSPHGLGASLAMVPFFLLGEWVARFVIQFPEMRLHHFFISLMNPLLTALTCVMLYLFLRRLRLNEKTALLTAFIYGLFTPAFPYSKVSFDVALAAFLLLTAVYSIFRYRQSIRTEWIFVAGFLLGCALLTRIATIILLPVFALYVYYSYREIKPLPFRLFYNLFLFIIPIVLALFIIGWYNTVRFGAFYEDGHAADSAVKFTTPLIIGFVGQLISPGKGLFFYSPVLVFVFFGVQPLYKVYRWETVLIVGIIIVNLLFHSKLVTWSGDWCWGPRFCIPIVPFMCIIIGGFLGSKKLDKKAILRKFWIGIVAISFVVQILGVTIDGARRIGRRYMSRMTPPTHIIWHPAKSPIIDHGYLLSQISFTPVPENANHHIQTEGISYEDTTADFWFVYLWSLGFPATLILGSLSVLIIMDVFCVRVIVRHLRRENAIAC